MRPPDRDHRPGRCCLSFSAGTTTIQPGPHRPLTTDVLRDKIKGGWAGQTIGVTFGGPTEFRYRGTMIEDYTPIAWNDAAAEGVVREDAWALRRHLRRPHLRERHREARR